MGPKGSLLFVRLANVIQRIDVTLRDHLLEDPIRLLDILRHGGIQYLTLTLPAS
jgi:hypothetical protein